jgi:hypothetical protein
MAKRMMAVLLTAAAAAAAAVAPAAAQAASGPVYPVANTSEYPPDGVYFRNGPDWNNTSRVPGWGVYRGDRVRLNCWQNGADNVMRRSGGNNVWYIAVNVTRPARPGGENSGWINAHFVDDGAQPYKVAPGVPPCTAPASRVVDGGSVYYSPYDSERISYKYRGLVTVKVPSLATVTKFKSAWAVGHCSGAKAGDFPDVTNGRRITTLSGWSRGRQGPVYLLRDDARRRAAIHLVVLFDPGSYDELRGDCTANVASRILQNWLLSDARNQLIIFAGKVTRDVGRPTVIGGRKFYHRGIQEVYFPRIRGTATSSRVTVCNYDGMSHEDTWINFRDQQNHYPPKLTRCPTAPDGTGPSAAPWHP